ncbi:MAG: transglycosylase domain-containing protein, partial [Peptococcaceae bacterium]|nr:transglycosylase domain-containing protein [Peptococcaceae bacterium]
MRTLCLSIKLQQYSGSITQQLAKNQFFTQKKQLTRKIAEVFMVREIEKLYEKDEILELYINSIYYGDGYYCIADASRGYFGKEPWQMNAYECTLLAGIPNAPSV